MKKPPPLCNEQAIKETTAKCNESTDFVRQITSHYFETVMNTMQRGAFEGVEVPNFGKFRAKLKYIQNLTAMLSKPKPITIPKSDNDEGDIQDQ